MGPMLPSGFIIPVITVVPLKSQFSSNATVATVIIAPADGPPIIGASVLTTKKKSKSFASILSTSTILLATLTAKRAEPCISICVSGIVSTKTLPLPLLCIVTVMVEIIPTYPLSVCATAGA